MKSIKLLLVLVFLLLPTTTLGSNVWSFGSTPSCDTTIDGLLASSAISSTTGGVTTPWTGAKLDATILTGVEVTEYRATICDSGGGTGNVVVSLWTDNSNEPGTEIAGTEVSMDATGLPTCPSYSPRTFTLDTAVTLESDVVWLVTAALGGSSLERNYGEPGGVVRACYSNGVTWTCLDDYAMPAEVYGCE